MKEQKSLVSNAFYNFILTGLNLAFPLVIAPYVSRILGAANLGKVNFATAVVNWFIMFAVFGTTNYGIREIAKIRDNKEQLDKIFTEIVIINGTLSLIVTIIYFLAVFNIEKFYMELPLYMIMSLSIILNMFAIDWFYVGIEEYRYITIRSAIFKTFSLICIFMFVKQAEHYVIYGLISVMAASLSGILNYIHSIKFTRLNFKNINPFRHFRSLSVFFVHIFIVNIYTNLDQILLGFWINTNAVAFMNRSKAIAGIAVSAATAISTATLSRSSYYKENNERKFRDLLSEVSNYILWITIPIAVGSICLASNIMFILGGVEFLEAVTLFQVIAPTMIFAPLSTYLQLQVLIASGKEKLGLYCAIITSAFSLSLNIVLIPKIGFLGAGIVNMLAELSAVSMRYYIAKRKLGYIELNLFNKSSITYLFAAMIMAVAVVYIKTAIDNLLVAFVVGASVGAVLYFGILLIAREKVTIYALNIIKRIHL